MVHAWLRAPYERRRGQVPRCRQAGAPFAARDGYIRSRGIAFSPKAFSKTLERAVFIGATRALMTQSVRASDLRRRNRRHEPAGGACVHPGGGACHDSGSPRRDRPDLLAELPRGKAGVGMLVEAGILVDAIVACDRRRIAHDLPWWSAAGACSIYFGRDRGWPVREYRYR